MAKFLFTYFHSIEGVVKGGKPKGGSLVQTLVWMKSLHSLGHEVYQVKYEGDSRELLEEYSWVQTVPVYDKNKMKKTFVWFSYRFPKYYLVLRKLKCDYIYISMPHWTIFFLGLICRSFGIKQIVRIANDKNIDKSLEDGSNRIQNYFQDLGIKNSFLVLAQNNFQFEKLKSKFPSINLQKISNPIVIENTFISAKIEFKGYLAWLANFRYQKNLALLYSLARNLPNEYFKVAGQPLYPLDEETDYYYQELLKLNNVEFVGVISRKEVFQFLEEAKFLLSTSRYEGFSNTFLESMLVGTPILTTPAVNPDGIIDEFGLGYLYNDEIELEKILHNLSTSDYLSKSMNCITYVKNNHDHLLLGTRLLMSLESKQ